MLLSITFIFFKQKTAYEMRISDWSSDVCSSDLLGRVALRRTGGQYCHQALARRCQRADHVVRQIARGDRLRLHVATPRRANGALGERIGIPIITLVVLSLRKLQIAGLQRAVVGVALRGRPLPVPQADAGAAAQDRKTVGEGK